MSNKANNVKSKNKKAKVAVDKRSTMLKYTSVFSVIILLVIVLFFNIIIDAIFGKKLTFDFTAYGQNSISDTTKDFIDSLPDGTNIRIVGLFDEPTNLTGSPFEYIIPLLEDYEAKCNGKITLEYINPESYPYILSELDPTGVYDLGKKAGYYAIAYEGKVTTIDPYEDCFVYEQVYNPQTGYNSSKATNNITEATFTNTMVNLTSGFTNKAYIVQDLTQNVVSNQLSTMLKNLGVEVEYLDFGDSEFSIPSDCELLILNCIQTDVTERMALAIDNYLSSGGKVIVTTDFYRTVVNGTTYNNLNSMVLNQRGLNLDSYMIMESDNKYLNANSNQTYEYTALAAANDVATLADSELFYVKLPMGVSKIATKYDNALQITSIITTSPMGLRLDLDDTGTPVPVGNSAQYNLAMMSTTSDPDETSFQLYVFGTSTFTSDDFISEMGYSHPNVVLIRNLIKNMLNVENSYDIPSKALANYSVDTTKLNLNSINALVVILVAVIPLGLIVTGTIVYTRRKNL